tara:strand:+ start:5152 stop:5616 length:465 start_codon:yes stop_codon:yes gene_type:complete
MKKAEKIVKGLGKDLQNNALLVVAGGLLLGYLLYQYSNGRNSMPVANASPSPNKHPEVASAPVSNPASVPVQADNSPEDLLPADGNSEWSEFAPHGQGDLMGSGSLLHPKVSQRPFNSVQGSNALRGDPQISIGDIPTIAAPSNPIQGNPVGLN